ncbi:transcription regulator [Agrilactobacillus composti DSM 18527 = JCM 14202]|uniref:HTH-type transcriptional regulator SarZ n=1 Tax=Agrilactobacillus composti DSM 18527 = JCM 14202 TaxID=1423734 RepID=X0PGV0_9LACO|nr:transcription regulator [Agrilactobacillus composti DSM 18527 = JCM 14202]GAF41163.1 organic hydroperoxide resistance transcriptional regulator [Agrilactobacillus composti DSM 18527 = JCM 14202]
MIPEEMKLANQLCFSVYNANRLFIQFYQKALKPFDLTYTQYIVLLALWEQDHQNLHDLGAKLDFGSNTLTPLLRRLETAGWLVRLQPAADRRQLVVELTDKGKASQGPIFEAIKACVGQDQLDVSQYKEALKINDALIADLKTAVG